MSNPDTQIFAGYVFAGVTLLLLGIGIIGCIPKKQKFTQAEIDKDRKALEDLRYYYLKTDPLPERHIFKTFSPENNTFMQKQYDVLYHSISVSRIKKYKS